MAFTPLSFLLITLTPLFLFFSHQVSAQAPGPAAAGPLNFTAILEKGGQYTTLLRLLSDTQVANQIDNQLNTSSEGLTVFAPTDNAFNNLKAGTLNGLSREDQVNLILFHICPKYYTLSDLLTVPNPVRTQFSTDGLNFTGQGRQVNVTSGMVETQVNNALRMQSPLAVYQVDAVLLPPSLFGAKPPASAPPPAKSTPAAKDGNNTKTKASGPSSDDSTGDSSKTRVGLGLFVGIGIACMAALS
ncbi:fasciclin-like arabinogalactan protein 13 [Humulus lupulus]|uniref:fasciclin-like arabinogalactan protein 13 n=1 Tax=Humulus lupulus TaxID=3486 RepID=UPI002B402520|nr:fasciclin-like arabinogalactan protein 13 [Humulus lupulus]